jgi:hypothetical protein
MFSLHNSRAFLLLIFAIFALARSINPQPTYNFHFCLDQSNVSLDAIYTSNLRALLGSLCSSAFQNNNFDKIQKRF